MLLLVTNRCNMMCAHCMQDSKPNSNDFMSMEVVDDFINFTKNIEYGVLMISGGEPTLHPQLYDIVSKIYNESKLKPKKILIASNGDFIFDSSRTEMVQRISKDFSDVVGWQISSFKYYYKLYNKIISNSDKIKKATEPCECYIETDGLRKMIPLGRASKLKGIEKLCDNQKYKNVSCINNHLIALQSENIQDYFMKVVISGSYCSPAIDSYGNIRFGESIFCQKIGSIKDDPEMILYKSKNINPCGKCYNWKYSKKLWENYKKILSRL